MRKRSLFNLGYNHPMTFNMGQLIPCRIQDAVPGDTFRGSTSAMVRLQPLLAPVMHKVNVDMFHYFVPHRLLWEDFDDFITSGEDGDASPTPPTIELDATTGAVGSLADYFRMNPVDGLSVSALPYRAYAMCFNEFFRDEQLVDELPISYASGVDTTTSTDLKNAAWRKDYFTNARPSSQLGASVTIPLTGDAPVKGIGPLSQTYPSIDQDVYETDGSSTTTYAASKNSSSQNIMLEEDPNNPGYPNVRADMSQVSGVSIRDLRFAEALQRTKEKLNRAGARPREFYQSFFGVSPQDVRMDVPEFLGRGRQVIQMSEVLQTAEGTNPVGMMRGHGISAGKSNRFKYNVKEFGFIMSFIVIRPDTMYMNGLPRMFSRSTRYDYLIPDFANIGDQEIKAKEIFADGSPDDEETWGFTPRYEDYRREFDSVSGEYRTTLDFWTMARDFATRPSLNADFVTCTPTDRIYAVTSSDQCQVKIINDAKVKRVLPKRSNPRLT